MTDDIVRRYDFAIGLGRRAGELGMTFFHRTNPRVASDTDYQAMLEANL
ncbi:hypothetical protein [Mesorhizobium sp. J428]|nr:hypothetical protein [Mesorhizobium sp. J428]MCR5857982.1 hypothetical protein [Mesorhizobium sp. J428]